jgi:hypothetical protein
MDELRGVTLVSWWWWGGEEVVRGAMRRIPGRWFNIKPFGRSGCDKGLMLNQQNLQAPRVYWTLGINLFEDYVPGVVRGLAPMWFVVLFVVALYT